MTMTPEIFLAWVGGLTALITGLIKGLQMLMTALGVTPEHRKANQAERITECEKRIADLEDTVEKQEQEIERLRIRLREEQDRVATMEGLFYRLGLRPNSEGGWGPPTGGK